MKLKYTAHKGPGVNTALLIFLAVTVVFGAVVIGTFLNSYIDNLNPVDLGVADSGDTTLDSAYWQVVSTRQSTETASAYDIDLESSIGNLRTYTGVRSFGLSNDGKRLAAVKEDNFLVIDLAADTTQATSIPYGISGNKAASISWSFDDKYFALGAIKTEDGTQHILVVSAAGEVYQDIQAGLAYKEFSSEKVIYPVYFSPTNYHLLARKYEQDNGAAKVSQMPVTLAIYQVDGRSIWEETIRGSALDSSELIYGWGGSGKQIVYATVAANTPVNFADQHLFTMLNVDLDN